MKKSLLVSGASKVDPNEIYRNDFNDVSNLIISTDGGGTVTSEDPIGTVVLPRQALTIDYPVNGKNYATVDLGQTYDELYIQFYVSVVKTNQTSGYDEFCQIGSTDSGGGEVTEMKYLNSTTGLRPAALPSITFISEGKRIAKGEIFRVGVHINKSTLEGKYYFNGKLSGQVTINNRDLRYITLGGTNDAGTKVQFSNLTVNTNNFSKAINTPNKIGEVITVYIDPSMDESIDASNFSGMHNAPYDPDGGTNYIDGAVRYTSDLSGSYFQVDGKSKGIVRIKDGTNVKLKDFSDTQSIVFGTGSTDVDNNYLVTSYSGGNVANYQSPNIDTSITLDPSVWSVHDAANNIYVANLGYSLSRLKRVWYDEQLGLRTGTMLPDLVNNKGLFLVSGTDLYVRLWDESDPSTHSIDIGSNIGFSIQNFCTMRNVTKRIGGMASNDNTLIEYCDFTLGSSVNVANNSIVQYSHFYNNWAGGTYAEQQFNAQEGNGITVNSYGIAHANTVEDSYIGIQIVYGSKKPLVCFNVVKNIIVNYIQLSGSVNPHTSEDEAILIVNNTVFTAPRFAPDIPYPMANSSTGHGFVFQSGGNGNYATILNNLFVLHYNHSVLPWTGGANCYSGSAPDNASSIIDFNIYYKTPECDTWATYFTSGVNDDFQQHKTVLDNNGHIGYDGDTVEQNSYITTDLPVTVGQRTVGSGKWLETDAAPTVTGNGAFFDFDEFGITLDGSGKPLTSSRNIGAY